MGLRQPTVPSLVASALLVLLAVGGCGTDAEEGTGGEASAPKPDEKAEMQRFPEILAAEATATAPRTFDISVTISSPYDSPERYADGWRLLTEDGETVAEHTLLHDHAAEQPFTRTQTGVDVDRAVGTLLIEPHDLVNGYGGPRFELRLPSG